MLGKIDLREGIYYMFDPSYQESQYFTLVVENGNRNDRLNLTVVVQEKEQQIVDLYAFRKR